MVGYIKRTNKLIKNYMQLESCPKCGIVVDLENMFKIDEYYNRGSIGEYFEDDNYLWIYCPACKEKVFLQCND